MRRVPSRRSWLMAALLAAAGAPAAGSAGARDPCATVTDGSPAPPYLAILSAFPAELAPFVAAAEIESTIHDADARPYYVGRLDGVSVVLGLSGIGILNATDAARGLLDRVEVAALLFSGVAGTSHRIGDVVLATAWVEQDRKGVFRPNRALLALARRAVTTLPAPLENCAQVPPMAPDHEVCLAYEPAISFGGLGVSGDPFGGNRFPCVRGGNEIIGCELPLPMLAAARMPPDVEDMETAAVARVAAKRKVPFLGIRAASDGAGDPLGDRGFPTQFFDYYRLAAANAAVVTRAVVAELGRLAHDPSAARICQLLARRRWRAAARRISGG